MAKAAERIHFINSSFPGDSVSMKTQRRIHSHAARMAHAKARHALVERYQASQHAEISEVQKSAKKTKVETTLDTFSATATEASVLLSIDSLLSSDRRDPFDSFIRPFKPIEHYLLDHYVNAVLPYMNIHCNKFKERKFVDLMCQEWVRLTLTNEGSLDAIFLAACRHLLRIQEIYQQQQFTQLATLYKISCVQALRKAIMRETDSSISDPTFALSILLAYDELQLHDLSAAESHMLGLVKMVDHNGGPQTMGSNGFLERLVSKFVFAFDSVGRANKHQLRSW